jgi:hypothetical protein
MYFFGIYEYLKHKYDFESIKFKRDDLSGNIPSHIFHCIKDSRYSERYSLDICETKKTSGHIKATFENLSFYYKLEMMEETLDFKVLKLLIDLGISISEKTKNNINKILNSTCSFNGTDEYSKNFLIQISQDYIQNSDRSFKIEDLCVVNIFNEDSYYFIRNNMLKTPPPKSKFDEKVEKKIRKKMKKLNIQNKNNAKRTCKRCSLKVCNEDINFFFA